MATRPFIIYPENNHTYRMFQYFLVVLSIYSCSVSPFMKAFIAPLPLYVIIIETIINAFFGVDIILSLFFVAYIDKESLAVVDNRNEIFLNAAKAFFPRIILIFPFELLVMQSHHSSTIYRIFTTFCAIIRLFRALRVHHLFLEFEDNENFSYIWVRLAKMILVCILDCHYGGCLFYYIATFHGNPYGTWFKLAGENFLKRSLTVRYFNSIYWAVTSFTTVGFGDVHAVTTLEKIFSIYFLLQNIIVMSYVGGNVTNLLVPAAAAGHRARRRRVLRFCRHHNLPGYIRDQVTTHLKSEYVSRLEPSEEHGIFKSLPRPIPGMIQQYLYNNYVKRVCHLFKGVSNAIHIRLVHEMEPIIFLANTTVIIQDESPTCLYFVVRGSMELKYSRNGVEQDGGTVRAGDVFGQSCGLSNMPQVFTAKTMEVCQLLKLDRDTLFDILRDSGDAKLRIMDNEIEKLRNQLVPSGEQLPDPYMNGVLREIERMRMEANGG